MILFRAATRRNGPIIVRLGREQGIRRLNLRDFSRRVSVKSNSTLGYRAKHKQAVIMKNTYYNIEVRVSNRDKKTSEMFTFLTITRMTAEN